MNADCISITDSNDNERDITLPVEYFQRLVYAAYYILQYVKLIDIHLTIALQFMSLTSLREANHMHH